MVYTCLLIASAAAFTSGIGVKLSAAGSLPPIVTPTLPCSTVLLLLLLLQCAHANAAAYTSVVRQHIEQSLHLAPNTACLFKVT
jgi:hypothetical protein